MRNQPTNLGAITERRIERVLTREGCMELALNQIIMKCDGSDMQTKRIRNIRERAKAGLEGRDPSGPGELGHVPPNHLLMAQLELSGFLGNQHLPVRQDGERPRRLERAERLGGELPLDLVHRAWTIPRSGASAACGDQDEGRKSGQEFVAHGR